MKLRRLNEPELVAAIRDDFRSKNKKIVVGIGDDAAIIKPGQQLFLITKDLLIEGTHFRPDFGSAFLLGRKSLAVNLSDIAAMGGKVIYCLLGLGLPASLEPSWVEKFMAGFNSLCQEEKVSLIGGDICRSDRIVLSVTVVGATKKFVGRHRAKPGDTVWVSGSLGLAAAGLRLLKERKKEQLKAKQSHKKSSEILIQTFLDPKPQLRLGYWLAHNRLATAMIDTSDGLSIDLNHICEESGVGAEIDLARIPVHPALKKFFSNPWPFILHGGEDYQLLFTVPETKRRKVIQASRRLDLHEIGRIIEGRKLWLIDLNGHPHLFKPSGFQHFKP